jgi:hypothetical protein
MRPGVVAAKPRLKSRLQFLQAAFFMFVILTKIALRANFVSKARACYALGRVGCKRRKFLGA